MHTLNGSATAPLETDNRLGRFCQKTIQVSDVLVDTNDRGVTVFLTQY
jgi:hypothetical protein